MRPIHLRSLGILAPGLLDWPRTASILRGEADYAPSPLPRLAPALLPPNERRRATPPTRLALEAARQATDWAAVDTTHLATVFASSDGDLDLIDQLCTSLTQIPVALSPTLFHNSVHNAVAGYWSIGSRCHAPSTSIAAGDGSLAAGLIESAAQLAAESAEILLVAYDLPGPPVLDAHRHFEAPFACALLLGAERGTPHLGTLELRLVPPEDGPRDSGLAPPLEALSRGNPAARILPLLHCLALRRPARVQLPYLEDLALSVILEVSDHDV